MIFGECPNCNGFISNPMPEQSPAFAKRECEHCNKGYWLKCSRIDSKAYTIEGFEKEYSVNEETKVITPK